MTDTNVFNACKAAGLNVGCQALRVNCAQYTDALCVETPENNCGNPMMGLSMLLCPGMSPGQCMPLWGLYQYMGHKWQTDSACGAEQTGWCTQGNMQMNRFALCTR
jgi:hypothetical protein